MTIEIISITSGRGPLEAREFVALLASHIEQRCVAAHLTILDIAAIGSVHAPASVAISAWGAPNQRAAHMLRHECGTHALIARSPHRGRAARKRWFAAVSIFDFCEPPAAIVPALDDRDLIITAARAGGKGGQHVNKVATAVRVVHRPSNISVRVAAERSQKQNLRIALARIAHLLAQQAAQQMETAQRLRHNQHNTLIRGAPVCTYHRTASGALIPIEPRRYGQRST